MSNELQDKIKKIENELSNISTKHIQDILKIEKNEALINTEYVSETAKLIFKINKKENKFNELLNHKEELSQICILTDYLHYIKSGDKYRQIITQLTHNFGTYGIPLNIFTAYTNPLIYDTHSTNRRNMKTINKEITPKEILMLEIYKKINKLLEDTIKE